MVREAKAHNDRVPARPWRRIGFLASALLCMVMIAPACSGGSTGPGVAGGGSSSSPTPSAPSDPRTAALAYSQCMRDHGVPDFPDPNANGEVNDPQLEESSGVVSQAEDACEDMAPEGEAADGGQQAAAAESALAYAECMRDHGISGFPDPVPDPGGGWVIPKNGKYDPLDPAVRRADEACLNSIYAHASPTGAPGE
jgi:hypothetical protein